MDFKNLNGVWRLKRFCITFFKVEFFFNFDFQIPKTHLKSLVFEILFIGD